jgi:SAM-dependent methyltransferase
MDYDYTFQHRSNTYKYATETYPTVLDNEFNTVIKICNLLPNQTILNIHAAGVPLHQYITHLHTHNITYIPFETNHTFAEITGIEHARLNKIPVENNSVDTIISVASLHHTTDSERQEFYLEARRILKPTGKLIIADVILDSNQDKWLNEFCNKYNSIGHTGKFWSKNDAKLLESCGYNTSISTQEYTWDFPNQTTMIDYCKNLFGLDLISDDTTLLEGIRDYLHPETNIQSGSICIPWQLMYFIFTISPNHALVHP